MDESAPKIQLVQAAEAGKMLGVHAATLIRWARQGRIPAYAAPSKSRTSWLFDIAEITKVLRENAIEIAKKRRFTVETVPLTRERVAEIARQVRMKHATSSSRVKR